MAPLQLSHRHASDEERESGESSRGGEGCRSSWSDTVKTVESILHGRCSGPAGVSYPDGGTSHDRGAGDERIIAAPYRRTQTHGGCRG